MKKGRCKQHPWRLSPCRFQISCRSIHRSRVDFRANWRKSRIPSMSSPIISLLASVCFMGCFDLKYTFTAQSHSILKFLNLIAHVVSFLSPRSIIIIMIAGSRNSLQFQLTFKFLSQSQLLGHQIVLAADR